MGPKGGAAELALVGGTGWGPSRVYFSVPNWEANKQESRAASARVFLASGGRVTPKEVGRRLLGEGGAQMRAPNWQARGRRRRGRFDFGYRGAAGRMRAQPLPVVKWRRRRRAGSARLAGRQAGSFQPSWRPRRRLAGEIFCQIIASSRERLESAQSVRPGKRDSARLKRDDSLGLRASFGPPNGAQLAHWQTKLGASSRDSCARARRAHFQPARARAHKATPRQLDDTTLARI